MFEIAFNHHTISVVFSLFTISFDDNRLLFRFDFNDLTKLLRKLAYFSSETIKKLCTKKLIMIAVKSKNVKRNCIKTKKILCDCI